MSSPLRVNMIYRRQSKEEADKENRKNKRLAAASGKTSFSFAVAGDPMPHRLPVVYYSSLEVIMISRILGLTYSCFYG